MSHVDTLTILVRCVTKMTSTKVVIISLIVSSYISIGVSESIYGKCDNAGKTFNCSGVGISDIPEGGRIPSYMETLDFSYNHISNITFLNYPALNSSLSTIDLSNNQISVLKNDAFRLLTNLVSLNLSNNVVSGRGLNERMFYDLKRLRYLNMEKNPLRLIKKDTFSFMELPSLKHLDISHCEISEMEASSLDLSSLEYLDLSWNQLRSFSRDSFRMLTNLRTLDMSHNRISVLSEVPYMPALVTWMLDSNGMKGIEIREELGNYADGIQRLYLRNNDIERFDADSFPLVELDHLQVIDLANNKLKCDCRMRWIRDDEYELKEKNYTFICESPKNVRNSNLLELAPEDLKCGTSLSKILFIVMISTLAVLVFVIVTFLVTRRRRHRRPEKKAARGDSGGNYTAVYTRDDEDVRVTMSDNEHLLANESGREFDV